MTDKIMYCSVCTHPKQIQIVEDYIYRGSLRQTAEIYGIGYRSLQRHIDFCIASIYSEVEEREYKTELDKWDEYLRIYFGFQQRKVRPKSIIKKPVRFTWSRRAWKPKKDVKGLNIAFGSVCSVTAKKKKSSAMLPNSNKINIYKQIKMTG